MAFRNIFLLLCPCNFTKTAFSDYSDLVRGVRSLNLLLNNLGSLLQLASCNPCKKILLTQQICAARDVLVASQCDRT